MSDIYNIIQEASSKISAVVSSLPKVAPKQVGLDERCPDFYIDDTVLIIPLWGKGNLEYYGGFEYASKEAKTVIGDWAIYNAEEDSSGRVQAAIQLANGEEIEDEDDNG